MVRVSLRSCKSAEGKVPREADFLDEMVSGRTIKYSLGPMKYKLGRILTYRFEQMKNRIGVNTGQGS